MPYQGSHFAWGSETLTRFFFRHWTIRSIMKCWQSLEMWPSIPWWWQQRLLGATCKRFYTHTCLNFLHSMLYRGSEIMREGIRPSSTKSTPRAVLIVGWFGKRQLFFFRTLCVMSSYQRQYPMPCDLRMDIQIAWSILPCCIYRPSAHSIATLLIPFRRR